MNAITASSTPTAVRPGSVPGVDDTRPDASEAVGDHTPGIDHTSDFDHTSDIGHTPDVDQAVDTERIELLATLDTHRGFLRTTVQGIGDDQARVRSTASELTLAGLIKHVAAMEHRWIDFVVEGPSAFPPFDPTAVNEEWTNEFLPGSDETLEVLLDRYEAIAERTVGVINAVRDLNDAQLLPEAPWFEPGAAWSVRRVLLHLIAETAQHAGHADIIRESIDGAKTMG